MHCPSCLIPVADPLAECPSCGLSLSKLDRKFATVPRLVRFVADIAEIFTSREVEKLQTRIESFERKFAGAYISVVTMEILPRFNPREYVFWLFNRCNFAPAEARLERNFSILILIDPANGNLMVSTGYGLHQMLPESFLQAMVDAALPQFRSQHYLAGCKRLIGDLEIRLKTACRDAKRRKASPKKTALPAAQVSP